MTSSFSKYDKKQRQQTVSQTGQRSRYSQMSQGREMPTHDNSTSYNFDLSMQNLLPLIEHLKQENQQLKSERDQIQIQMQKLKSMSEAILQQNAQMRQHYQQRTNDIRKVITTMSINMNEEIQDINHLTHMVKNHNYSIVKNIQRAKKQIQEKDQEVQKIQQELTALSRKNTQLQQEIITRNVKIRQLQKKLNQLTLQKERENNVFKLQQEVDRLTEQVHDLRNANMKKLRTAQSIQMQNQIQKPHYTAQNINVVQTINVLTQELSQMKQDSQSFRKNLQNLKNYNQKTTKNCKNANKQRQSQTLKIQQQQSQIKRLKGAILLAKTKAKQLQVKKSQKQQQKYNLQKEKRKKQQKMQKIRNQFISQKQNKRNQLKQKSTKQRNEHNLQFQKNSDQLTFKLNPEKQRRNQLLEQLVSQYKDLEKQVDEMKRTAKNMDNPVNFNSKNQRNDMIKNDRIPLGWQKLLTKVQLQLQRA